MGAQGRSALGAFGPLQCVTDLDAKVADRALSVDPTIVIDSSTRWVNVNVR